jgi:hypothetical protein
MSIGVQCERQLQDVRDATIPPTVTWNGAKSAGLASGETLGEAGGLYCLDCPLAITGIAAVTALVIAVDQAD